MYVTLPNSVESVRLVCLKQATCIDETALSRFVVILDELWRFRSNLVAGFRPQPLSSAEPTMGRVLRTVVGFAEAVLVLLQL